MVRADHGAVDHLDAVWRCAAIVEGIEHQFPKSGQGPAPELAIHARPLAELFRQITPGSTGSSNPENAIKNKAVVGGRATALPPDRYQKGFKECPLGILHQQPRQDNLRKSYLESHLAAIVNPVCQQGLNSATLAVARAETREELNKALHHAVTALGFDSFNLSCGKYDKREFMLDPTISSWNEQDIQQYEKNRWAERDPLLEYAASRGLVRGWRVADWRNEGDEEYARYLEYSGLKGGVTAPLNSPSGALAAITVLSASRDTFDSQTIRSIPLLGTIVMMRLEALGLDKSGLAKPSSILANLSDHQREILRWAAHGKSNRDIGEIIGQKKRTVDYHIKAILTKLGVSTKMQAVAIYSCFADAGTLPPPGK